METSVEVIKRGRPVKLIKAIDKVTTTENEMTKTEIKTTTTDFNISLIGEKVKTLRFHQATNIKNAYKGTIDHEKDLATMIITESGVLCEWKNNLGKTIRRVIAMNNVFEMDLFEQG